MQPLFTYFTENSFIAFCTRLATYFTKKYYIHFCTNFLNHSQFQGFYLISNPMSYRVGYIPDGDGRGFFSFLQKSKSMLSPDELEVVGLLELQAFIEAKSVQLGEAFIDEDLLCMVSQFAPIVEDQVSYSPGTKTAMMVGRGLSLSDHLTISLFKVIFHVLILFFKKFLAFA